MANIGSRIRAARESAQLTQASLADAVGVRVPTIWRYEKGGAQPRVGVLVRIAGACRVSLDWLATGEGEGPPEPARVPTADEAA